jgi:hypothetical protein
MVSLFLFKRRYLLNSLRNVSDLLRSPVKMVGATPFRPLEGALVVVVAFTDIVAGGSRGRVPWSDAMFWRLAARALASNSVADGNSVWSDSGSDGGDSAWVMARGVGTT